MNVLTIRSIEAAQRAKFKVHRVSTIHITILPVPQRLGHMRTRKTSLNVINFAPSKTFHKRIHNSIYPLQPPVFYSGITDGTIFRVQRQKCSHRGAAVSPSGGFFFFTAPRRFTYGYYQVNVTYCVLIFNIARI